MKNITRLVILFRIHKIHQLKKYQKQTYICSHLLGLAIRLKLIEAQNLPLGKIRGSGCPSKVPINSCYTGEDDEDKDEDAVNSPVKLKRRGRPLGSRKKKRI